ncbi:ATP-dependent RNA helicase DOB1 [Paragonimus heterotremus]|uniref:ATP-dependent RNA helicase DOB1 n=1 Tax=Paragonimus heterotremus TaxID=100268 RepID=A0A8J4WPA3_9TREM|nr:ATP-dependent RNA helicase DOB1 [Paragonimus heterotremus]
MDDFGLNLDELESSFVPKKSNAPLNSCNSVAGKRRYTELEEAYVQPEVSKRSRNVFKFQTSIVSSGQGCLHEVVYPVGETLKPLTPIEVPARNYPFTLDSFQKQAILCVDNGQSVLVSAHTSAGKTVVAEYAVARSLKHKQRVIYTTPIKALSNQKFREFTEEFKDVGLMTGDITINPEATVLIMTTEILRSMLYRGSEVTREVGWVIFDEIHYLRDKERGVVWEETIILLPDSVGLVFLSATIPNARQFAEWIVYLHKNPCHVVYTDYRPVPLQHYVFPCGGDGIHLVVNQKREFIESNFNAALLALQKAAGDAASDTRMRGRKGGSTRAQPYCAKLVKLVMDQNLEPLIVFSFSKIDCEYYATQMNKMDFNTDTEKAAVDLIFNNAIDSLSAEDKRLPQVQILLPVLRRGVGIHHGGLLPILKEIVEILFGEGLIKVLYATETFAMGLNMPARTVLFTATRKFDGHNFRLISSGEYIQMSGRAGRRGKDDRGTVILMLDNRISSTEARQLLMGEPDRLDSSFYLTNNMVLNLLRVEDINPELLLEKSFFQFQHRSQLPSLDKRIKELEKSLQGFSFPEDIDMDQLDAFAKLRDALTSANRDRWSLAMKGKAVVPFLQPGRVVRVHTLDDIDFGWGIVLHINQSARFKRKENDKSSKDHTVILVECLLEVLPIPTYGKSFGGENLQKSGQPIPLSMVESAASGINIPEIEKDGNHSPTETEIRLVSVPLACLAELSSVCMTVNNIVECASSKTDVLARKLAMQPSSVRRRLWEGIQRAKDKLGGKLPLLDPIKDMNNKDNRLKEYTQLVHVLESRVALNPLSKRTDADQLVDSYTRRALILRDLNNVRRQLQNNDTLFHQDELHARKRLLRRLGFCSEGDIIAFKGRVACEISSGDELMLTELLLDGLFSSMSPAQSAGVLSCFVVERSSTKQPVDLRPDMVQALETIQAKARFLARAAAECRIGAARTQLDSPSEDTMKPNVPEAGALLNSRAGLLDDEQAYVDRFSGELMEVVRAWAEGVSFARLCELTSVFEGSVIRCMRRLDELLRQMHDAAKVAGNVELENKFSEAMVLIKRDIVFAASLYL